MESFATQERPEDGANRRPPQAARSVVLAEQFPHDEADDGDFDRLGDPAQLEVGPDRIGGGDQGIQQTIRNSQQSSQWMDGAGGDIRCCHGHVTDGVEREDLAAQAEMDVGGSERSLDDHICKVPAIRCSFMRSHISALGCVIKVTPGIQPM